ncbi:hypothetical protein ABK040_002248 [Willaertia magna]
MFNNNNNLNQLQLELWNKDLEDFNIFSKQNSCDINEGMNRINYNDSYVHLNNAMAHAKEETIYNARMYLNEQESIVNLNNMNNVNAQIVTTIYSNYRMQSNNANCQRTFMSKSKKNKIAKVRPISERKNTNNSIQITIFEEHPERPPEKIIKKRGRPPKNVTPSSSCPNEIIFLDNCFGEVEKQIQQQMNKK